MLSFNQFRFMKLDIMVLPDLMENFILLLLPVDKLLQIKAQLVGINATILCKLFRLLYRGIFEKWIGELLLWMCWKLFTHARLGGIQGRIIFEQAEILARILLLSLFQLGSVCGFHCGDWIAEILVVLHLKNRNNSLPLQFLLLLIIYF